MRTIAAVFVHGIFSGTPAWDPLVAALTPRFAGQANITFHRFGYPSPKIRLNPLKRIPDLRELGGKLATFLSVDSDVSNADRVVLIGHSQGGLVILECLAQAVTGNRSRSLDRVSECLLFCTPTNGSQLLLSVRKGLGRLWHHAQERRLRPLDEHIGELQRTVAERIVFARTRTPGTAPMRITACVGAQDAVVPPASSRWVFPRTEVIDGTHSGAIVPANAAALTVTLAAGAIDRARSSFPCDGDLVETVPLTAGDAPLVEAAVDVLRTAFPAPLAVNADDVLYWLSRYERNFQVALRVFAGTVNGDVRGFLMFHEDSAEDLIVVDYLATSTEDGTPMIVADKLIERLRQAALASHINHFVFEVEKDTPRTAGLIRLFTRLGGRVIDGLTYHAVDMARIPYDDARLPHFLVYATIGAPLATVPRQRVEQIVTYLYERWYARWLSRRWTGREPELDAYLKAQTAAVLGTIAPAARTLPLVDQA